VHAWTILFNHSNGTMTSVDSTWGSDVQARGAVDKDHFVYTILPAAWDFSKVLNNVN